MNNASTILLATLALAVWQPVSAQQVASSIQTLRGAAIDDPDKAPEAKPYAGKLPGSQKPIARTFSGQPPLIPHSVEGFPAIALKVNSCLVCHEGGGSAPKAGLSHFKDRDGKSLTQMSPARYQCTSCHVPQTDVKPLVENTFKGAVEANNE